MWKIHLQGVLGEWQIPRWPGTSADPLHAAVDLIDCLFICFFFLVGRPLNSSLASLRLNKTGPSVALRLNVHLNDNFAR